MGRNIIKHGSQSMAMVVIVIGILVFANIILANFFFRIDLTENKEFTITESTKSILSKIDDIVNIKLYFSNDLPAYLTNLESQIRDMLSEYQAYAGNKINVEFIDPKTDPDLEQKLQRMGIPELQLTVIEKDQRQVRKAYLGISIQYGDKNEVIPVIKSIDNLEYDLTRAVFKVTDTTERTVGWIGTRNQQAEAATGYEETLKVLEEEYSIRNLEPGKLNKIQKNINAVIVDGNQDLSDRALYAIDQYILEGGKAIFLTDAVGLSEEGLSAAPKEQPVHKLLSYFGISIEPKLVIDRSNAYAAFNSGFMRFSLPYPFWPKILAKGFAPDDPAVSKLESLVLPWVSPIQYTPTGSDAIRETALVQTTEAAGLVSEPFDLNPQQRFNIKPEELAVRTLAIRLDGSFKSFFAGKPIPPESTVDGPPPREDKPEEQTLTDGKETSLVVISNSRFINNQFAQMFPENVLFMHNLVDSFVIGDQLIGIRSRQVTDRPLDYQTTDEAAVEKAKTLHRLLGTFAVPLITILFGVIRFSMQSNRRQAMYEAGNER